MKKQILFNPDNSGADICRTIKHSYNGCMSNLIRTSTFGQTGVLEIYTMQEVINTDSNGNDKAIRAFYGKCGFDSVFRGGGQGITRVIEEVEPKMMQLVGDRCNPSVSVKETAFTVCSTPMSDRCQMVMEPKIAASRGRGKGWKQKLEINDRGTSNTITTSLKDNFLLEKIQKYIKENPMKNEKSNIKDSSKSLSSNTELKMEDGCMVDKEGRRYRIRKLTPTECFRLMDVDDEDIEKMKQAGIAKTNLYKLAGNSIVVSCMYHIFRKLFIEKECESNQISLF